jgi:hypothetical protein
MPSATSAAGFSTAAGAAPDCAKAAKVQALATTKGAT